jgi:hypothetical protein
MPTSPPTNAAIVSVDKSLCVASVRINGTERKTATVRIVLEPIPFSRVLGWNSAHREQKKPMPHTNTIPKDSHIYKNVSTIIRATTPDERLMDVQG